MTTDKSIRIPAHRWWYLFISARKQVDRVGKIEKYRPVEHDIFPIPEPKRTNDNASVSLPLVEKDTKALFWQDVRELTLVLNADGTLWSASGELRSARKIAGELIASGISWADEKKVRAAQRRLAKRQKVVAR